MLDTAADSGMLHEVTGHVHLPGGSPNRSLSLEENESFSFCIVLCKVLS